MLRCPGDPVNGLAVDDLMLASMPIGSGKKIRLSQFQRAHGPIAVEAQSGTAGRT